MERIEKNQDEAKWWEKKMAAIFRCLVDIDDGYNRSFFLYLSDDSKSRNACTISGYYGNHDDDHDHYNHHNDCDHHNHDHHNHRICGLYDAYWYDIRKTA